MAGRGRGRGQFSSLNTEALGIKPNEFGRQAESSKDPPPIYPPLGQKQLKPLKLPEHDYMLAVMKDYVNQMRDSQFAISRDEKQSADTNVIVGRYSDSIQGKVQRPLTGIDWKRYPKELAPSKIKKSKRTSTAKVKTDVKRRKLTDTANILDKLEKNEENEDKDQDDDETSNPGGSDKDEDETSNKDDIEEDEVMDEELDEGTDYANNYFDNGENYLDDEDDNLDEGGIF